MVSMKNQFHQAAIFLTLILLMGMGLAACQEAAPAVTPAGENAPETQSAPPKKSTFHETLKYAIFPAPPYMIGAGEDAGPVSGIDVDIVQEMARRMDLKVTFIRCTWTRCLELMKNGEVDLLSSAYKKPDREEYMLYFQQPFLSQLPIAFYYPGDKPYKIEKYEDIYQFERIGVLSGASYFERFDQDSQAKKVEVPSQDQLFPMLMAGRLDIMAGYIPTENYRLSVEGYSGKIVHSTYVYQEQALVYMAVSKKSPFAGRMAAFDEINKQLLDEGFIQKTIQAYYEKYK